jgi:hypothetical protein
VKVELQDRIIITIEDFSFRHYLLFEWNNNEMEETYFKVGVVGPVSGAEWSQKSLYNVIGNDEPEGWHHQLSNQPTLGLGYLHSVRYWQKDFVGGTGLE